MVRRFNFIYAGLAALHLGLLLAPGCGILASVTKAFPVLLLLCLVAKYGNNRFAVAALACSAIGDILAEFNFLEDFRMPCQIFFFFIAQILYTLEFLNFNPKCRLFSGRLNSVLPFMMGVYGLVEVGTLVSACLQKRRFKNLYIAGAAIFLASDFIILVRKITGGFPLDDFAVMLSYFAAQYLMNIGLLLSGKSRSSYL